MLIRPPQTTFTQRLDKTIKFYDFTYHTHKSTFKGLSALYKTYSQIQKQYADSLMKLAKDAWTQIPELARENASLVSVVKEVINCMQTTSQLHYNFAERLSEIGTAYTSEYMSSKRKKDIQMRIVKDKNEEQYNALRQRQKNNRNALNGKQKQICGVLYQNLQKLAQQQNQRIHKVKQQTIIFFSLYKKVCQKQLQWASEYNLKLVKQEFQVKNPKITEVAQQLRNQYNQYGGDQIEKKSFDVNKSMIFAGRESMRASIMMKQRTSRIQTSQNQLIKVLKAYQHISDSLFIVTDPDDFTGLIDDNIFNKQNKRKYSRQINGQTLRNISYDMIQGYSKSSNLSSDQLTLLQLIKASLKARTNQPTTPDFNCPKLDHYFQQAKTQITDQQYIFHLKLLQQLSKTQPNNHTSLDQLITRKHRKQLTPSDIAIDYYLNFAGRACILDLLMESLCVSRPNEPVLAEGFVEYLGLIARFGEQFLRVEKGIVVLLLLRKLDRLMVRKEMNQEIEGIITDAYMLQPSLQMTQSRTKLASKKQQDLKFSWSALLLNSATNKIIHFYKIKSPYLNYLKMLLVIQRLGLSPHPSFSARDHFYSCIRCAGFNYMKSSQQCAKVLNPEAIAPESRLQHIVQGIQDLDYEGIVTQYLNPASAETSKLLGVGQKILKVKIFQEFIAPTYDFIQGNLNLLSEQQGVDRDGYILRLGIIFAKLDIQSPQPINRYQTFFKVLKTYLQSTQKHYDKMLQHSRQTQLWIMQQNALATPNCIDFCSLLYKPFQFLLISLKQLQKSLKTDYTKRYSQFIKLRLNTVLKNQIIKYINFLYQSLASYKSQANEIVLKPRKLDKPHLLGKEQSQKERQGFKELTRRLFNLVFLRDQLEEMVCDFLEPEVYKKLDNSIFNIEKLNKLASQVPEYRDILLNIKEIVEAVLANQQRIVSRIASITVFHCMSKIFQNLYYQQQKNAIQQFFSNTSDYKLSQHTFLKYQQTLQDWFLLISKNLPDQFLPDFQPQFCKSFLSAIELQVLNSNKFKLPLKAQSTIPYLDADVTFVSTMMRQKFFDDGVVSREIREPFRVLLADLQAETGRLVGVFQQASLRNDKGTCRYVLAMLNLRVRDQKALEFVKKYKAIAQM